jgi:uncharacterized protein (DUF4213/DUF364 family)
MRKSLLTMALVAFAHPAGSDGEQAADLGRSPGDMTVEERVQMMQGARGYDNCVYTEAIARIDGEDDIRRIADMAMGQCEPRLDDLRAMIERWGFNPHFALGFTRNVRDRAARKVLPELAVRKSR